MFKMSFQIWGTHMTAETMMCIHLIVAVASTLLDKLQNY